MEIVEGYQSKLLKIEQAVLVKPLMKHVVRRKLRLLSAGEVLIFSVTYA